MTANLDEAAGRFRFTGELTEAEMDDLQIPSVADSQRNKKPKDQRLLHQQRAVIMNSVDCVAKYKNHCVSIEIEAAQKLMARHERDAARDATRETKQEKDRFANLSKEEKTAERKAKRAANAATKAALIAASGHYAMSPADAIDDDDNEDDELDLFRENEIFNLD